MKLAFIAFLLFVGSISAKIRMPQTAAACVTDIKGDILIVEKLVADYEGDERFQILVDLVNAKRLLVQTLGDCKGIQKQDILDYLASLLTPQQKGCADQLVATIQISVKTVTDIRAKSWSAAMTDSEDLILALSASKTKCNFETSRVLTK